MDFIIKSDDVTFEYNIASQADEDGEKPPIQTSTTALDGVSVEIAKGDFVAVLGHNGSGKSTLAKHLNALLMPTSGVVWVKGISTNEEDKAWEIRQSVGMVFQNPDNQIVATIVEEDVAFGPENLGVPPLEIRERVDGALVAVGMSNFAKNPPHYLSGGQKQRVAIAGILAMKPDVIVLDESTAMLDPIGRREVMKVAKALNDEGITIVLITHYMDEAARADRIIVMSAGRVILQGVPKEVFSQIDTLKSVGLDVPQAAEIAHKLRLRGVNLPEGIVEGEELVDALAGVL